MKKTVIKECEWCGMGFEVIPSRVNKSRFCREEHYYAFMLDKKTNERKRLHEGNVIIPNTLGPSSGTVTV